MKAIVCTKYGSPDVLKLKNVEKPAIKDNEVLIKIHAAAVTSADSAFRRGDPFISRFFNGLLSPRSIPVEPIK
ncbi:hypothetical protein ACJDU8_21925 [Clostridium sp. WILCCON 0269]|uniref:NAD(P)-dependent alcohol dehydrogenase n=1 Tax=Candidatus Clostridium eludens TaxID=3381663 RepID=A0ABW8SR92_9CLOT